MFFASKKQVLFCVAAGVTVGAVMAVLRSPADVVRTPVAVGVETGEGLPEISRGGELAAGSHFTDVTLDSGIDFIHSIGDSKLSNLVESVGSGAAFLDYDQDGQLDVYVLSMTYRPGISEGPEPEWHPMGRLYRQGHDGRFDDVTVQAGLNRPLFALGLAVGDYDRNGYPDIYVGTYGSSVLFRNNGDGTFTDVTRSAGVGQSGCTTGAVFLDYDRDGELDLYVVRYVHFDPTYRHYYQPDAFPGPLAYAAEADVLYRNRGDGTFVDVSREAGFSGHASRGMGVAACDFDRDGDTDLFVANDAMANDLWVNDGRGHFRNEGVELGVAYNQGGEGTASMAGITGDIDGDGWLDLFVPDNSFKALFSNQKGNLFTEATVRSGVAQACGQYVTWASGLEDFDQDGDLDLFCVNGPLHYLYGQEDVYLRNRGDGIFDDVSSESGEYFGRKLCGRGACFGDYDDDGDIDVFIVNLNDHAVLLRNDWAGGGGYLEVQLEGTRSHRDAVGSILEIVTGKGTRVFQRMQGGYLSANAPRIHIGLGVETVVSELRIRWPSGATDKLESIAANQTVIVTEGGGWRAREKRR